MIYLIFFAIVCFSLIIILFSKNETSDWQDYHNVDFEHDTRDYSENELIDPCSEEEKELPDSRVIGFLRLVAQAFFS